MGDDIVKDLRFCAPVHAQMGYPENAKLFTRAANEIERLRSLLALGAPQEEHLCAFNRGMTGECFVCGSKAE